VLTIEAVFAELDHRRAADEQLLFVAELAHGLLLQALEAALQIVGLHRVAERRGAGR
jgi:hypothetical protein